MYTVEYKAPLYKTMEELDDFFSDIAAVEKKADAAEAPTGDATAAVDPAAKKASAEVNEEVVVAAAASSLKRPAVSYVVSAKPQGKGLTRF